MQFWRLCFPWGAVHPLNYYYYCCCNYCYYYKLLLLLGFIVINISGHFFACACRMWMWTCPLSWACMHQCIICIHNHNYIYIYICIHTYTYTYNVYVHMICINSITCTCIICPLSWASHASMYYGCALGGARPGPPSYHSCHILPFEPILWDRQFPPEPARTAKHSPKSISEGGRIWQVWLLLYYINCIYIVLYYLILAYVILCYIILTVVPYYVDFCYSTWPLRSWT